MSTAFHGSSEPTTARRSPVWGLGSLTPLSAWWVKLGIVPERIEPGHPEQNGRLERLHRTLKAETATPPKANRRRQRRALGPLQAQLQRREAARGPGTAASESAVHALVQVLSCTHQLTGVRSRSHGTQCPQQRRNQVEGRPAIRECVSQRRARRPRTTGRAEPGSYSSAHSSSASSMINKDGSTRHP